MDLDFGTIMGIVLGAAALFFGTQYFRQRSSAKSDKFLRKNAELNKDAQKLRADEAEDAKRRMERRAEEAVNIPGLSKQAKEVIASLKEKGDRKLGK
jgi:gas vesicle protein